MERLRRERQEFLELETGIARIAAGRTGTAEKVAAAVAFLASGEAASVNGQDLVIDGVLVAAIPAAASRQPRCIQGVRYTVIQGQEGCA